MPAVAASVATTVITGAVDWWKKRSESKARIEEAKVDAVVENIKQGIYEEGWKDEYLLLIWSLPMLAMFVTPYREHTLESFALINNLPDWYKYGFLGITASVYGLPKLAEFMPGVSRK